MSIGPTLTGRHPQVPAGWLTLDRSAIVSIATGQVSGELAELVRRKVIVDLPKRYY